MVVLTHTCPPSSPQKITIRDRVEKVGLVTIHREQKDAEMCSIGRIVGIDRDRVSLLEINPDATWEKKPTDYRLSEITRVNFGGDYEDALAIVGGGPPQANMRLETDLRTRSQGSRASAAQPSHYLSRVELDLYAWMAHADAYENNTQYQRFPFTSRRQTHGS